VVSDTALFSLKARKSGFIAYALAAASIGLSGVGLFFSILRTLQ
jgi:hypothetical protein